MLIDNWQDFARVTVETGDLDPMYDLIYRMRLAKGFQFADRFALHFFMFYDAGEAAKCAYATQGSTQDKNFWDYAENGYATFRRGTERRHFRGDKGLTAIKLMRAMGTPSMVWDRLYGSSYSMLVAHAKARFQGCQIGPYFMWKAMDILDRGLDVKVSLSVTEAANFMPDEPRKCAETLWPGQPLVESLKKVVEQIHDLPAPGAPGKYCSYAEAETVLCMIKGFFLTKTHTIGDDVDEKHAQLKDYPELCELLPKRQDWSKYERGSLGSKTVSIGGH